MELIPPTLTHRSLVQLCTLGVLSHCSLPPPLAISLPTPCSPLLPQLQFPLWGQFQRVQTAERCWIPRPTLVKVFCIIPATCSVLCHLHGQNTQQKQPQQCLPPAHAASTVLRRTSCPKPPQASPTPGLQLMPLLHTTRNEVRWRAGNPNLSMLLLNHLQNTSVSSADSLEWLPWLRKTQTL